MAATNGFRPSWRDESSSVSRRAGCFLDQLLIPPLERAFAFAECPHLTMRVGEGTCGNSMCFELLDGSLQVDAPGCAEGLHRFGGRRLERAPHLLVANATMRIPRPAATAAGLHHHRESRARAASETGMLRIWQAPHCPGSRGGPNRARAASRAVPACHPRGPSRPQEAQ